MKRVLRAGCGVVVGLGCLVGCDVQSTLNKGVALYLKQNLLESCGQDDPQCASDVEGQFDSCHEQYKKQWHDYMAAPPASEDEYLRAYSEGVYGCIVDARGNPYFVYNPNG